MNKAIIILLIFVRAGVCAGLSGSQTIFEAAKKGDIAALKAILETNPGLVDAAVIEKTKLADQGWWMAMVLSQTVHEFSMEALNTITARYTAGLLGNPLLWPYRVHMNFRVGRKVAHFCSISENWGWLRSTDWTFHARMPSASRLT